MKIDIMAQKTVQYVKTFQLDVSEIEVLNKIPEATSENWKEHVENYLIDFKDIPWEASEASEAWEDVDYDDTRWDVIGEAS